MSDSELDDDKDLNLINAVFEEYSVKPSDHLKWLQRKIIEDGRHITYRVLSRELKCHHDAAKRMLHDFYNSEDAQAAKVYSTWIVTGTRKGDIRMTTEPSQKNETPEPAEEEEENDVPPSSPPLWPSQLPAAQEDEDEEGFNFPNRPVIRVSRQTIQMCREEELEETKEKFEEIDTIHVYSISPLRPQNFFVLKDCSRQVFQNFHAKNDPLIHNKDYGVIHNSQVRRRKVERPPMPVFVPRPQPQPKVEIKKPVEKPTIKPFPERSNSSRPGSRDGKKPTIKKENSLFQAFAKQNAKPKISRTDSNASGASDAKMSGMDDDEGVDDDAMFLDTGTTKRRASEVKQEKDERAAKLRKMMDEDDAVATVPKVVDATEMDLDPPAAKKGEDPDVADWSASDSEKRVEPRRKRGRRKVTKKKTMQDEDGFLVTREEEAWESFSEDEPVKPAFKPLPTKTAPKPAPSKGGAGGPKKDIMSFFKKK